MKVNILVDEMYPVYCLRSENQGSKFRTDKHVCTVEMSNEQLALYRLREKQFDDMQKELAKMHEEFWEPINKKSKEDRLAERAEETEQIFGEVDIDEV